MNGLVSFSLVDLFNSVLTFVGLFQADVSSFFLGANIWFQRTISILSLLSCQYYCMVTEELHRVAECCFEANSSYTATNLPSPKPYKKGEQNMLGFAGQVRMNTQVTFFDDFLHMDTLVLIYQQKIVFISSVQTVDTI